MRHIIFRSLVSLWLVWHQVAHGQELEYLDQPEEVWTQGVSESQVGNGLYLSPDGSTIVGVFADGSLRFFNPSTGDNYAYTPTSTGVSMTGVGGVAFAYSNETSTPYLVYAVADNANDPTTAQTRVLAVTPSGELLYESEPLTGVAAGTPQTTYDGRYIMVTHNVDQEVGYFTILDTTTATSTSTISEVYSYMNETNPFSPLGVYHNPIEGYYAGGESNTNDLFIWAYDTAKNASAVGYGQTFAFQMPIDPTLDMAVVIIGEERDFQASTAPVITNSGLSMYWAVSRSQQLCWVGTPGLYRDRFDLGRTESVELRRGNPVYISGRASPSLSSDPTMPFVYGPGASNQIYRLAYNFSDVLDTNTSAIVSSRIAVSPDDLVIYYASQDGTVAQLDATTLETRWTMTMVAPVYSDIALNEAGTILYAADASGLVTALQVATYTGPTPSPTIPGTSDFPSSSPSFGPEEPSAMPSLADDETPPAPTQGGTKSPSALPVIPTTPLTPTSSNRNSTTTSSTVMVQGVVGVFTSAVMTFVALFYM